MLFVKNFRKQRAASRRVRAQGSHWRRICRLSRDDGMPGWRNVVSIMHSLGKNSTGPNGRWDKRRGKMGSKPPRRNLRRTRRRRRRIAARAIKSALLYGIYINICITGYHALTQRRTKRTKTRPVIRYSTARIACRPSWEAQYAHA